MIFYYNGLVFNLEDLLNQITTITQNVSLTVKGFIKL